MTTAPGPWSVAKIMCNNCNHVMTYVYPVGVDFTKAECTKCGKKDAAFIEGLGKTFGGAKR